MIKSFSEFIKDKEKRGERNTLKSRIDESINCKEYLVIITVGSELQEEINENKHYEKFKKTSNRYSFHAEDTNIPVKAHYHIYPSNGKIEIYAVNVDGTAHHRKNKGYKVPSKEAAELRKLGIVLPDNNILEYKEFSSIEDKANVFCYLL